MRRQFPTLGRKMAGDFLPRAKVGEGKKHTLFPQGLAPPVLILMHFRLLRSNVSLEKRGFGKLYDSS